jgi:hypothetical protein
LRCAIAASITSQTRIRRSTTSPIARSVACWSTRRRTSPHCSLRSVFLPSARGARDLDAWHAASGAETLATEAETAAVSGTIDLALYAGRKLSRTIDFLPMSGVTAGSCALRIKTNGGVLFFGPILEPGADGWPTLVAHADDASPENRLIGALGLQDVAFEYAFTDVFEEGRSRYGPGAGDAVKGNLRRALEAD